MKIKKGFRLRPLGQEYILVAEGLEVLDANTMVSMNATAAFLWESIEGKEFAPEDLVQLLLDEYDVDRETAEKDVKALLQTWNKADAIEE
jgi:hypothetical protein